MGEPGNLHAGYTNYPFSPDTPSGKEERKRGCDKDGVPYHTGAPKA